MPVQEPKPDDNDDGVPDAPSKLAELTGEPRENFTYDGEIRDLSEMELSPIDESETQHTGQ